MIAYLCPRNTLAYLKQEAQLSQRGRTILRRIAEYFARSLRGSLKIIRNDTIQQIAREFLLRWPYLIPFPR